VRQPAGRLGRLMADPAAHPAFRYGQPSVAWLLGAAGLPAAVDPDTSAIRWAGSGLTYRELRDRALRLAGSLRASGLVVGDRVAAHLLNRGEFFELYFACAYAGLTFVPVSFRLTSEEVSLILEDCQARRLFTQEDLADTALPAAKLAGVADVTVLGSAASGQDYAELLSTEPWPGPYPVSDPHLILFSSGTTGRPKGAMLSHRAIVSYAMQQAALYPAYDRKTVLLITGPLFNTGGINDLTIATLLVGGTVTILPSRGWSAARMAEHIRRWGVTHTIVFPSMMEPMIRADQESPLDLGTLKLVVTGGENCPVAAVQRFRSRWPHLSVAIGYGSTEVGLASLIMNDEIGAHPGSVGRPAGGAAIKVVGERGEDVPAGSVGEIWMAADTAFSGYLNAPELNAETFRDGWVASGDLGRLDDDGYLYIEGRKKDVIISGGQNIYPAEIENVLSQCDDLLEVAVIGVQDARWGEAVCAVVVPRPGRDVTAAQVIAHVTGHLASYKKPRFVVFVDHLPRNAVGKVNKRDLRDSLRGIGSEG